MNYWSIATKEKPFVSVYQRISKKGKDNWMAQQEKGTIQMYTIARVSEVLLECLDFLK